MDAPVRFVKVSDKLLPFGIGAGATPPVTAPYTALHVNELLTPLPAPASILSTCGSILNPVPEHTVSVVLMPTGSGSTVTVWVNDCGPAPEHPKADVGNIV